MGKINEQVIIQWALKYHSGQKMTKDEKVEFEEWLSESSDHVRLLNSYRKLYIESRQIVLKQTIDETEAWSVIRQEVKKSRHKLYPRIIYVAATLLLAIVSTWFVYNNVLKDAPGNACHFDQLAKVGSSKAKLTLANGSEINLSDSVSHSFNEEDGTAIAIDKENALVYHSASTSLKLIYNTIQIPRGGEYAITLSDGSKVWLNSGTELRYPVRFQKNQRNVYLTGEAYFEVAHDSKSPFVVNIGDTKVKVLGTKFNISGYSDEVQIATTLVEGSVKVDYLQEGVILKPGQQSLVLKGQDGISTKKVDTSIYTSWVQGVFEFEDTSLEQLCKQLGRWYDVDFFFTEPYLKNIRFTGAVKRNQSITYAFELIEQLTNVEFKSNGDNIVVKIKSRK